MKINKQRMKSFYFNKSVDIALYSMPILIVVFYLNYSFGNHVLNALFLFYVAYAFKSALFITAVPFTLESEFSEDNTLSDEVINNNQVNMENNYPIINKINNVIMTIHSILLVSSFIYFSIGLTIEGIKLSGKG